MRAPVQRALIACYGRLVRRAIAFDLPARGSPAQSVILIDCLPLKPTFGLLMSAFHPLRTLALAVILPEGHESGFLRPKRIKKWTFYKRDERSIAQFLKELTK
jgi:hypothetical protein